MFLLARRGGQIASTGTLTHRYTNGPGVDAPLIDEAFTDNAGSAVFSELRWLLTDYAGSVRDVLDAQGGLAQHVEYDQFGEVDRVFDGAGAEQSPPSGGAPSDLLLTDLAFAGREWDAHAGLYYNRARWYDSGQGRFISEDPIGYAGGDANLYRYAGGDPVNYRDPTGLFDETAYDAFYSPPITLSLDPLPIEAFDSGGSTQFASGGFFNQIFSNFSYGARLGGAFIQGVTQGFFYDGLVGTVSGIGSLVSGVYNELVDQAAYQIGRWSFPLTLIHSE